MVVTELSLPDRQTTEQAADAAEALRAYLEAHHSSATARLTLHGGREGEREVQVPSAVFEVLASILTELARGNRIAVAPVRAELTTQQAADLLNVSRPYLVGLLDAGDIPCRRVGNRRKVLLADVVDYQRRDDERRRAILDELTAEAQEMGLYD